MCLRARCLLRLHIQRERIPMASMGYVNGGTKPLSFGKTIPRRDCALPDALAIGRKPNAKGDTDRLGLVGNGRRDRCREGRSAKGRIPLNYTIKCLIARKPLMNGHLR